MQRPNVRNSVALDLLLMRQFAVFAQSFPQVYLFERHLVASAGILYLYISFLSHAVHVISMIDTLPH